MFARPPPPPPPPNPLFFKSKPIMRALRLQFLSARQACFKAYEALPITQMRSPTLVPLLSPCEHLTISSISGRFWCLVLAKARATHFDEADVRRILRKNVRDLLGHCRAADSTVRKAAHQTLTWYGTRSLPVVQQLIANDMLGRMEELLSGSSNDSSLPKVVPCTGHLSNVVKSLSKLQRQQWASLLFRFLRHQPACQQELVEDLQMLWLSENDCRSG